MKKLLQLDDFFMARLHVDWRGAGEESSTLSQNPDIDYRIGRNQDNRRQFAMELSVQAFSGKAPEEPGYEIDARIQGVFSFAEDATEEEMNYLIRVNGATILYGLLRGHIAAMTGAFPGQKLVLPAVYMQELIPEIHKRKVETLLEKRTTPEKALKKKTAKKKTVKKPPKKKAVKKRLKKKTSQKSTGKSRPAVSKKSTARAKSVKA